MESDTGFPARSDGATAAPCVASRTTRLRTVAGASSRPAANAPKQAGATTYASPVIATAVDFASVDPDEAAAHGWMVALRADGPGRATRVRRMAVGSARSVPRVADPGRLGIEATRAGETMMRALAVSVGREV